MLAESLFKSCIFSSKQGSTIQYHFPVTGKFPFRGIGNLKCYLNFSRASFKEEFAGRKVEGPLDLSLCF